ncbi:MFS transporter [Burkholderia gladioli]|uniref:MFS transporter n=1 Tax=Burkholderia gladioli TaxID=28095 RepID=UPI003F7A5A4B
MSTCSESRQCMAGPAWAAVFALAFGVFGLIATEFLPASLLTLIASSLGVSEGQAGQAVTATSAVALVTGLLVPTATRRIDRRQVQLAFMVLMIVSNLLAAFASDLAFLLFGRVLAGIAIGGFWTISAATTMRLVPDSSVPRALSIIFSGVPLATIAAVPLGSYLSGMVGWRAVFLVAAGLGGIALVWQWLTLPRMAPIGKTSLSTLVSVLRQPRMKRGILAVILVFTGHFMFFTYLRSYLDRGDGVSDNTNTVSMILFGYGLASFFGSLISGWLVERSLWLTMLGVPLTMSVLGVGLVMPGHDPLVSGLLVTLWGAAFGIIPVSWTAWMTRTVPDEIESGNALMLATIQFAIALGAAIGGLVHDFSETRIVFVGSVAILLLAVVVIFLSLRVRPA